MFICSCVCARTGGRGGSAIIMLIARNPATCIYQVFLFSARVGVFQYTFSTSYSDFGRERVGCQGVGGASL